MTPYTANATRIFAEEKKLPITVVGARVKGFTTYMPGTMPPDPFKTLRFIIVDAEGKRFMNEWPPYYTDHSYRPMETYNFTKQMFDRIPAYFIADETNTTVDGFLAHEVSDIVPEAITGEKDETEIYTDDDGQQQTRPVYQGIDQSKLVPLLTAALQEAITEIESLKARVTTLEG